MFGRSLWYFGIADRSLQKWGEMMIRMDKEENKLFRQAIGPWHFRYGLYFGNIR